MSEFRATYFDGRSSARREVRAWRAGSILRVAGEGIAFGVPLDMVTVEAPISGRSHLLRLPDGGQLRSEDVEAIVAVFRPSRGEGWVRRLEARWGYALGALALIAGVAAWSIFYGLPLAATAAAERLPERFSQELGEQTLKVLDGTMCTPSKLPEARQQALRSTALGPLLTGADDAARYRLEFRACRALGANAVALPDGTLVMTDRLVTIVASDEEIEAVLAHEIGHVRRRHGLRMTLQAAGVAVLVTTLATDAVTITSLAAGLPSVLLNSGYSRAFEDEADDFALARLREAGVSSERFASVLERLEQDHAEREGQRGKARKGGDYLATHPATAERIARARAAAKP